MVPCVRRWKIHLLRKGHFRAESNDGLLIDDRIGEETAQGALYVHEASATLQRHSLVPRNHPPGSSLCCPAAQPQPRLRGHRHPGIRIGHRRQHGHLCLCGCHPSEAAAVSRAIAAGGTFRTHSRGRPLSHFLRRLPGLEASNRSFRSLDVYRPERLTRKTASGAEEVSAARVSDGFFDTLGVSPMLGRDFRPGEDLPGAPQTVILSYVSLADLMSDRETKRTSTASASATSRHSVPDCCTGGSSTRKTMPPSPA